MFAATALIAVGGAPAAHAGQATCSNPGLPLGTAASSDVMPGRLSWTLTTGIVPATSQETLDDGTGPTIYDGRVVLVETRLQAEYALSPWIAIGAALPYRVVDVGVRYRDPDTGAEIPSSPNRIHARDETIRGIGDPLLLVHGTRELGAYRLHLRAGTTVPLGRTEEDPFALGAIGQEHQHVQLGTGTFVPLVAAEAQRSFGRVATSLWLLGQPSLYANRKGYRIGHRASAGVTASTSFAAWTFGAAAEVHAETGERWHGIVHEDEGNAGRVTALTGLAATWRPLAGFAVLADVKLPIYEYVRGNQLDFAVVATLGIAGTFDLGRRAAWHGVDHREVGRAGTAAPIEPVLGRITVVDLWATWCAPCRELELALEALAQRHPDRIAIRQLDVVDPESAAWKQYLAPGQFELPHVKVYGSDGRLLFERTAPPAELVRAIEATLSR